MADYIPHDSKIQKCFTELSLTAIEKYLGAAEWKTDELLTGDLMLSPGAGPINRRATIIASRDIEIFGDAILCEPQELI